MSNQVSWKIITKDFSEEFIWVRGFTEHSRCSTIFVLLYNTPISSRTYTKVTHGSVGTSTAITALALDLVSHWINEFVDKHTIHVTQLFEDAGRDSYRYNQHLSFCRYTWIRWSVDALSCMTNSNYSRIYLLATIHWLQLSITRRKTID